MFIIFSFSIIIFSFMYIYDFKLYSQIQTQLRLFIFYTELLVYHLTNFVPKIHKFDILSQTGRT